MSTWPQAQWESVPSPAKAGWDEGRLGEARRQSEAIAHGLAPGRSGLPALLGHSQ